MEGGGVKYEVMPYGNIWVCAFEAIWPMQRSTKRSRKPTKRRTDSTLNYAKFGFYRMSADDYTRPERYAERQAAKRISKRMDAKCKRMGKCYICIHREQTFGMYHCRNAPERTYPQCEHDGKPARFTFDDSTLAEFADAALPRTTRSIM